MEFTVTRTTAPRRPTAVLAATITWAQFPSLWRPMLDEVVANVEWQGGARHGRNVMLYLTDEPQVEVGVLLEAPARVGDPLLRSALPAGEVATTVLRGDYAGIGPAHDAVVTWCTRQGLPLAGPRWEVYGHWHDDPSLVETEIFWLLA